MSGHSTHQEVSDGPRGQGRDDHGQRRRARLRAGHRPPFGDGRLRSRAHRRRVDRHQGRCRQTVRELGRARCRGGRSGADRVPVIELGEEAWSTVLDVNLKGTFLGSRAVARAMLERNVRGRIVNISSNCGKMGYPKLAAYCASKFGILGFTQALAMELAPHGITVNAICPGAADTDRLDYLGRRPDGSFDAALRGQQIRMRGASVPIGRLATADDVAEVAAFLVSESAEYITGQAINVAGGSIMH
ncbi:MAG: hypothetical protein DME08_24530 [Candidatus Rokuibacteriota bacterium]|nr:MAG: hypothetical protein DME08_24530 [Candidatus Rokubacteria bacterium]